SATVRSVSIVSINSQQWGAAVESSNCAKLALAVVLGLFAVQPAFAEQKGATQTVAPAPAVPPPQGTKPVILSVWAGYGHTEHSDGGYFGGLAPLNGNLLLDGFAVRGDVSVGRYDVTVGTQETHGNGHDADLLIGYRKKIGDWWLTGYGGGAYQNN